VKYAVKQNINQVAILFKA